MFVAQLIRQYKNLEFTVRKFEWSGWQNATNYATENSTTDNLAVDEAGRFHQLRTVLDYLPNGGTILPPTTQS
jgi:hypothetical protein